jgi:hypothetical protein
MTNLREAAIGCYEVLREEGRSPEPDIEIAELAIKKDAHQSPT